MAHMSDIAVQFHQHISCHEKAQQPPGAQQQRVSTAAATPARSATEERLPHFTAAHPHSSAAVSKCCTSRQFMLMLSCPPPIPSWSPCKEMRKLLFLEARSAALGGPPPRQIHMHLSRKESQFQSCTPPQLPVLTTAPQTKCSHMLVVSKGSTRCKGLHKDAKVD